MEIQEDVFAVNSGFLGAVVEPVQVTGRREPTMLMAASDLVFAARRAVMLCLNEAGRVAMGSVRANIRIDYGDSSLQFTTTFALGDHDPQRFNQADLRSIRRLVGHEMPPPVLDGGSMPPVPRGDAYDDTTEVIGDVGIRPQSRMPDVPPLHPLETAATVNLNADSHVMNASLLATIMPPVKYAALAEMIMNMHPPGSHVVIFGNHPGRLVNNLIAADCPVTGYDPLKTPLRILHVVWRLHTLNIKLPLVCWSTVRLPYEMVWAIPFPCQQSQSFV